MNQYIITAYDYTDIDAFDRRMSIRPHHLDTLNALKASDNYILGGALLNPDGKMIGSTMIMQFETEEGLEAWKKGEPYITEKIWEMVDVKPFKVAEVK